jgi:hypothetical protein
VVGPFSGAASIKGDVNGNFPFNYFLPIDGTAIGATPALSFYRSNTSTQMGSPGLSAAFVAAKGEAQY